MSVRVHCQDRVRAATSGSGCQDALARSPLTRGDARQMGALSSGSGANGAGKGSGSSAPEMGLHASALRPSAPRRRVCGIYSPRPSVSSTQGRSLSLARLSQCVAVHAIMPVYLRVFLALSRLFLSRLYRGHILKFLCKGLSPNRDAASHVLCVGSGLGIFPQRKEKGGAPGWPLPLTHTCTVLVPCCPPPPLSRARAASVCRGANRLKPLLIPLKLYIVWRAVAGDTGSDSRR
jgi:hypothetical protein